MGIRSRSKDNENATAFDGAGLFQIKEKNPSSKLAVLEDKEVVRDGSRGRDNGDQ